MKPSAALLLALSLFLGCGDGTTCNTIAVDLGAICLPDAIAPGNESVIEVRELCGPGCAQTPGCGALLYNGQLVLDVHEDVCTGGFGVSCALKACQTRTVRCRLPALAEGDYALVAEGNPGRILHVRAGGQRSCSLPAGQLP